MGPNLPTSRCSLSRTYSNIAIYRRSLDERADGGHLSRRHRVNTILESDRVLVLDAGKVSGASEALCDQRGA